MTPLLPTPNYSYYPCHIVPKMAHKARNPDPNGVFYSIFMWQGTLPSELSYIGSGVRSINLAGNRSVASWRSPPSPQ